MKNDSEALQDSLSWLELAQDTSLDGGVSAWFSLVNGWAPSYIETTGYIINTFLEAHREFGSESYLKRAIRMGDFLVEMQHDSGGYRTHVPEVKQVSVPTVFNTGQDLIGLSELYTVTKDNKYLNSVNKAADFLVRIQEKDGSWLKYTYGKTSHVYHTRVAWGLLESWKVTGNNEYLKAAKRNLEWALNYQQSNGWFKNNELPPPNIQVPYTHTIAYAVEGFLWSGILLSENRYIMAAIKGAIPPLRYAVRNEYVPGSFDKDWRSSNTYSCLTGDAQLAVVSLKLFEITNKRFFKVAGNNLIEYLKRTQRYSVSELGNKGAIAGSWPIWGDLVSNTGYCRLAYPNWAAKFFVDALFLKKKL